MTAINAIGEKQIYTKDISTLFSYDSSNYVIHQLKEFVIVYMYGSSNATYDNKLSLYTPAFCPKIDYYAYDRKDSWSISIGIAQQTYTQSSYSGMKASHIELGVSSGKLTITVYCAHNNVSETATKVSTTNTSGGNKYMIFV